MIRLQTSGVVLLLSPFIVMLTAGILLGLLGIFVTWLLIVAALLARTGRITVATDRLAASLHDPIRLAEDAIALDLLSGGRFILGLSLCYRDEEFSGFGVEAATDPQRLEALVPVLRAAFDAPSENASSV